MAGRERENSMLSRAVEKEDLGSTIRRLEFGKVELSFEFGCLDWDEVMAAQHWCLPKRWK